MSTFELSPERVSQIEGELVDTGGKVDDVATRAENEITGVSGSGWSGAASNAAVNQITGPFADAKRTLYSAINHISTALGQGRVLTESEDEANQQAITAITPDVGNFSRLAV